VVNAIAAALGVGLDRLPATPERIAAAWRTARGEEPSR
jgi:CO/xanthine dehydrogenase Mo-binding subunit